MSVTQLKAVSIAESVVLTSPFKTANGIDPQLILSILEIISKVIDLFRECKQDPPVAMNSAKIAAAGGISGWFLRRKLWKVVKNTPLPNDVSHESVYDSILKHSEFMTVIDMAALYRGD